MSVVESPISCDICKRSDDVMYAKHTYRQCLRRNKGGKEGF